MKASVSMWSLDRIVQSKGMSQLEFLEWAKSKGFEYVELVSYYMNNENNLSEVIDKLKKLNLGVSCYTILNDFSVLGDAAWNDYIRDIDAAAAMGAPFVRVLTGGEKPEDAEEKARIVKGLKQAAVEGEKRNIVMILENIGAYSCHSEEAFDLIKQVDSPYLRINFDTANALLSDEDPLGAFSKLLPLTAYVHFKDFITDASEKYSSLRDRDVTREQTSRAGRKMTGITAGEGEIPLSEMITMLKKSGYDGFISQEYEGTGDSGKDTEASLLYFQSLL